MRPLCNFVLHWRYLYISSNKQTNYSKILILLCLPHTFQAVLFQLKTPHTPTATRVSAWHELYSPLHLLIDIRGSICFLLRKNKLQFSVASRYLVLSAHHRSPPLNTTHHRSTPLTILCTSQTRIVICFHYNLRGCKISHRCLWRRVVIWELPPSSGSSSPLTTVWRQYGPSKRWKLLAKRGRDKCQPSNYFYWSLCCCLLEGFAVVTSISTSKYERFIEVTSCPERAITQCWVTHRGFKKFPGFDGII